MFLFSVKIKMGERKGIVYLQPSLTVFVTSCSQGKLVKYFSRQLSCKCKVALEERSAELEDFPRLGHWFRIVNLRKEVTQVSCPVAFLFFFFFFLKDIHLVLRNCKIGNLGVMT